MSIGGSSGESSSSSQSNSNSFGIGEQFSNRFGMQQSAQNVYGPQAPYLQDVFGQAQQAFNTGNPYVKKTADRLMGYGNTALDRLGFLSDPQAVAGAQLEGLSSGLNEIYDTTINKIGDNAAAAGAFGSGRHGLQEAALGGEIADAYTRGYGDITANAYNQALNANNAVNAMLPTLFNLGMGGQFAPLAQYASIIGDPTVLAQSMGLDLGTSYGYDLNAATAQSSSNSSDKKYGFSFGF